MLTLSLALLTAVPTFLSAGDRPPETSRPTALLRLAPAPSCPVGPWVLVGRRCRCPSGYYRYETARWFRCRPSRQPCLTTACEVRDPKSGTCRYPCNPHTDWCRKGRCQRVPTCDHRRCHFADPLTGTCRSRCGPGFRCDRGRCVVDRCPARRCSKLDPTRGVCVSTCKPLTQWCRAGRCVARPVCDRTRYLYADRRTASCRSWCTGPGRRCVGGSCQRGVARPDKTLPSAPRVVGPPLRPQPTASCPLNRFFPLATRCRCPVGWLFHRDGNRAICCHAMRCHAFDSKANGCGYRCNRRSQRCVARPEGGLCRPVSVERRR